MNERDIAHLAVQASGLAKKGLMLKASVIGGVCFLLALLLMGVFIPAPASAAATCEDTGPGTGTVQPGPGPGSGGPPASGSLRAEQIAHAKTIDSVAARLKLPGRATLIALMTAMQESTLRNLDYGHLDSLGLFQQRPSMNWGTPDQIRDPKFAAESFFQGRGGNPGLIHISRWQLRPPGEVAQAVQKSAHPGLYAGHESTMRALASDAGIDLGRAGSTTGTGPQDPSGDTPSGNVPSRCPQPPGPGAGTGGGTFTDGKQTWKLNNPRSVTQAIAWARSQSGASSTKDWYRRCLAFVAIVYGWNYSGVTYAIDHYSVVPADMRHDGDRRPPPGALMYWDTNQRAGHIAVYLGDGQVASNDIKRPGYIDIVNADEFEKKWGAKYIGWTPPHFPRAG
ncbi:peptidase M23 [Streptomyces sp. NPDC001889]